MARHHPKNRSRHEDRRTADAVIGTARKSQAPVSMHRYAAPGDESITIASRLILQEPFRVDSDVAKRLARREINPKEAFTIRDGSGDHFRASLKELNAEGGLALPYERMERSPEPTVEITLACAVLARQRMIFVMQKATELGVTNIVPLLTDHSVPVDGLEHEKASSWPGQIIRAAKQCRRSSLAEVHPPTPLDIFLSSPVFTTADVCVYLDDQSVSTPAPAKPPRRIVLLVGPEGGFSDVERSKLASKAQPWVLGGRILRAETAVIVGLTAVHLTWGDFSR